MRFYFVIFCVWAVLRLLFTLPALAQASFELANKHTPVVDASVFDAQGVPLEGTNYLVELWGAATPDLLSPLLDLNGGGGRKVLSFRTGGYFGASEVSVLTVPRNGWAWLQFGRGPPAGRTYEEVAVRGLGGTWESPLFYAQGSAPQPMASFLPH